MMGESSGGEDSVVRSHGLVYRFDVTSSRIYVQGPRHCLYVYGFLGYMIQGSMECMCYR